MKNLLENRNLFWIIVGLCLAACGLLIWVIVSSSTKTTQVAQATTTALVPSPTPFSVTPSPLPPSPTPTPVKLSVPLNPQHGIHAPVGGQWTDPQRQALLSFQNAAGEKAAPGLVVALSPDMTAANNAGEVRMEQDLFRFQDVGSQIFVRMYPQRFPGGTTEPLESSNGRNTISGTPEDAVNDIFRFLNEQQQRTGRHFTRIIPGNELNLEWPNANYNYNVLRWRSNDDPAKYDAINLFMFELYHAWQRRLQQPDAVPFRDVTLYFPGLAQDGNPDYFGGNYFYQDGKPSANKYDRLRTSIELYGRFTWHNYFRPGQVCEDRVIPAFPEWLKQRLANGWPAAITEAGWSPPALALPAQNDGIAFVAGFWQKLPWGKGLVRDDRPYWRTQDETVSSASFDTDLQNFIDNCAGKFAEGKPALKTGVAVWLAGSEGNFVEAIGVEPGPNGPIRRWLTQYAAWKK